MTAVVSTMDVSCDKNSLQLPRTSPLSTVLAAPPVIFALSFSFDHNVNIYTEPISLGDVLPFTQRHSFRKLSMPDHKGLTPLISMYISWISLWQSPNFQFYWLIVNEYECLGQGTMQIKILSLCSGWETEQTRWYSTQWLEWQRLGGSHPPCNY